jgi:hypothetical protein
MHWEKSYKDLEFLLKEVKYIKHVDTWQRLESYKYAPSTTII